MLSDLSVKNCITISGSKSSNIIHLYKNSYGLVNLYTCSEF